MILFCCWCIFWGYWGSHLEYLIVREFVTWRVNFYYVPILPSTKTWTPKLGSQKTFSNSTFTKCFTLGFFWRYCFVFFFFFIQYYLKTLLHCSITKVKIYIWIWCYYTLALEIDTRIQNYLANWECFADSTYFCFLSSNIPHRARDGTGLAFIFSKEWITRLGKSYWGLTGRRSLTPFVLANTMRLHSKTKLLAYKYNLT